MREGETLLARPAFLSPIDEMQWDARVWKCLDQITHPRSFDAALELDNADVGPIDLLDFNRPGRSVAELDELRRRRIRRRIVTLSSMVEKVEALAQTPPPPD
jgi:hypothetical protein